MQMPQTEIRKVLTFLKGGQEDPTSISTHLLIVALIMTRPFQTVDKVFQIIEVLCYDPYYITEHELRYVFNLVYQIIGKFTDTKIKESKAEQELIQKLFENGQDAQI
jgi:hypothetical protein